MTTDNNQSQMRSKRARSRNDSIQVELDELREQLEALKANVDAEKETSNEDKTAAEASADDDTEFDVKDTIKEVMDDLPSHFIELIESLDESLKDESTTKLLAVFAAGILVGRLLPR